MEDKRQFVIDFQESLIANGDGRYDYLADRPVQYEQDECGEEFLVRGRRADGGPTQVCCVSADSLTSIAEVILKMI